MYLFTFAEASRSVYEDKEIGILEVTTNKNLKVGKIQFLTPICVHVDQGMNWKDIALININNNTYYIKYRTRVEIQVILS